MIARAAAILEYLASGGVVEPPMMIVVAHPDDETIGIEPGVAGFLVRHKWKMAEAIRAAVGISLSDYLDALVDADHPGLTDAPLESLVKQPNWGEYHIQSSLQERLC
jgi:hypothetical protein